MPKKPEILGSKIVAQSRLFDIEQMHLKFSNGEVRHYERIRGRAPSAVLVIPFLDNETILLIREYATGMSDYVLAFPKGAVETEEDLLVTANRELMEEVGYGARDLQFLKRVSTSPGYMTSVMDLVVARDLYPQTAEGDEAEPLEVVPWSLKNIDDLLAHPEFHEARSIAALLLIAKDLKL